MIGILVLRVHALLLPVRKYELQGHNLYRRNVLPDKKYVQQQPMNPGNIFLQLLDIVYEGAARMRPRSCFLALRVYLPFRNY